MVNLLLFLLGLGAMVSGDCVISQKCSDPFYDCEAPYKLDPPGKPFPMTYAGPNACPMFEGQDVCCNSDQNFMLNVMNIFLNGTYGHIAGGCDTCLANLQLLWCYYACSPNQDSFLSPGHKQTIPNPAKPSNSIEVLLSNFTVTNNFARKLYNSCKKCPYIQNYPSMQSPEGFLQYLGYSEASANYAWNNFVFEESENAFDYDIYPCSSDLESMYGYSIEPCDCSTCQDKCSYTQSFEK